MEIIERRLPITRVVVDPGTFKAIQALQLRAVTKQSHDILLFVGPRYREDSVGLIATCVPKVNPLAGIHFSDILGEADLARAQTRDKYPDLDIVGVGYTYHPTLKIPDLIQRYDMCYVPGQGFSVIGTNNEVVKLPFQETIIGVRLSDSMPSLNPQLGQRLF